MKVRIGKLYAEAIDGLKGLATHFDKGMPLENPELFDFLVSMPLSQAVPESVAQFEIKIDRKEIAVEAAEIIDSVELSALFMEMRKLHAIQDFLRPISESYSSFYYGLEIPLGTLEREFSKVMRKRIKSRNSPAL